MIDTLQDLQKRSGDIKVSCHERFSNSGTSLKVEARLAFTISGGSHFLSLHLNINFRALEEVVPLETFESLTSSQELAVSNPVADRERLFPPKQVKVPDAGAPPQGLRLRDNHLKNMFEGYSP